jgi:hypothetical protein
MIHNPRDENFLRQFSELWPGGYLGDKYNNCQRNRSRHPLFRAPSRYFLLRILGRGGNAKDFQLFPVSKEAPGSNLTDEKGRGSWYHWSTQDACAVITSCGFEVLESDINVLSRDPVVHFRGAPTR